MSTFEGMDREDLLKVVEMFAKNWLAHDGCWFLGAEDRFDLDTAIDLDTRSWARFAAVEARRIVTTFDIGINSGLEGLARALELRMYAAINEQHSEWSTDGQTLRFEMDSCRVQSARRRKGLPDFPCKSVGIVEFSTFAETVDPRIQTVCLHCPPDAPEGKCCAWEFSLRESADADSSRERGPQ